MFIFAVGSLKWKKIDKTLHFYTNSGNRDCRGVPPHNDERAKKFTKVYTFFPEGIHLEKCKPY